MVHMLGSGMCWCRIIFALGTIVGASPESLTDDIRGFDDWGDVGCAHLMCDGCWYLALILAPYLSSNRKNSHPLKALLRFYRFAVSSH